MNDMPDELYICRRKVGGGEYEGATCFYYYEPIEPYRVPTPTSEARKVAYDAVQQAKQWPMPGAHGQMIGMDRYSVRIDNVDGDFLYTLLLALQQPDTNEAVRVLVEQLRRAESIYAMLETTPKGEWLSHEKIAETMKELRSELKGVLKHPAVIGRDEGGKQ